MVENHCRFGKSRPTQIYREHFDSTRLANTGWSLKKSKKALVLKFVMTSLVVILDLIEKPPSHHTKSIYLRVPGENPWHFIKIRVSGTNFDGFTTKTWWGKRRKASTNIWCFARFGTIVQFKACIRYFLSFFYFSPNDSLSETTKNVFYFT